MNRKKLIAEGLKEAVELMQRLNNVGLNEEIIIKVGVVKTKTFRRVK